MFSKGNLGLDYIRYLDVLYEKFIRNYTSDNIDPSQILKEAFSLSLEQNMLIDTQQMRDNYFNYEYLKKMYDFANSWNGSFLKRLDKEDFSTQLENIYGQFLREEKHGVWGYSIGVSGSLLSGGSKNLILLFNGDGDF